MKDSRSVETNDAKAQTIVAVGRVNDSSVCFLYPDYLHTYCFERLDGNNCFTYIYHTFSLVIF